MSKVHVDAEVRSVGRAIQVYPEGDARAELERRLAAATDALAMAQARIQLTRSRGCADISAARDQLGLIARDAADGAAAAGCTPAAVNQVMHHAECVQDSRQTPVLLGRDEHCNMCKSPITMTNSMKVFMLHSGGLCYDCALEDGTYETDLSPLGAAPRRASDNLHKTINDHLNRYQALGDFGDFGTDEDPQARRLFAQIRNEARARHKRDLKLTIYDVRDILKVLKRTDLYNSAPTILALVSGARPARLSELTLSHAKARITQHIREYMPDGVSVNYAYFIYRHLDAVIAPASSERTILRFIYLPNPTTLAKLDQRYAEYCRDSGQEPPAATDRFFASQHYAPK